MTTNSSSIPAPDQTHADWIDVTVPVREGMVVWPGDPSFEMRRLVDMDRGDICNVSQLSLGAHTGTHMDAPLHFVKGGASIDQLPLAAVIGPARVIEIHDEQSVKADELKRHDLKRGERLLFKTRNSPAAWKQDGFVEDFVHIRKDAAALLAEIGVQTVGIDYLSVGGYERDGIETHQVLLGAGIWLIEGLDLTQVSAGVVDLVCLPLKVLGAEGAPARVVVRSRIADAS